MPALNFKKQFAPHIRSKRKRHTIRAKRKRPIKPGDTLFLYTGMRTKSCEKIMQTVCVRVEDIVITDTQLRRIVLDGHLLDTDEEEALAYADGFDSFADMMKFWDGRLPFHGDVIHWKAK